VIRSAFVFNEPVRCLVHALKYRQAQYLARYMGEQMVRRWENIPELAGVNYVVPVPLFKKRYRRRGFNQSESLAQALARQLSLPLDTSCLQRIRDTSSQTKLGRIQRMQNMQGAFACSDNGKVKGKIVLLVDDVCTTGATLEACAVALRAAGAKRVMAFTYARE
jgi:ComF family protein